MFIPVPIRCPESSIPDSPIDGIGESPINDTVPLPSSPGAGLRPSVETAMHLALPHRVVIHVHSVDSIAWGVRRHGPTALREILSPFRWRWIRYAPSGAALAQAIRRTLKRRPDVFILANHGLVVGGETCSDAESRLMAVEERLAIPPRAVPPRQWDRLLETSRRTGYRLPEDELMHSLATDPDANRVISSGTLYPCQAMFLGAGIQQLSVRQTGSPPDIDAWFSGFREMHGFRPPALFLAGCGVLVARDITGSEYEMLLGLANVAARLTFNDGIRYLSDWNVRQVLRACSYRNSEANRLPYAFTPPMSTSSTA
jgi:hypothetical protein